jgi:D-alanine--poly(phosphoribitol) ligase subunit 1
MTYPHNLGRLFAKVCQDHAKNVAVKYRDRQVSYLTLDQMSDSLAAYLLDRGLTANDIVAIVNTKEPESLALMVACLKIGVAYTNIDYDNPPCRLETILNQCCPRMLFLDTAPKPELIDICTRRSLEFHELKDVPFCPYSKEALLHACERVTGNRIAYIMFTSGSTGVPKGVVITHQNVLNFIGWTTERFRVSDCDVFANVSPFYFDNSVFDFFSALFSGASIAPLKKEVLAQPLALLDLVDQLACTIWFSVPSMLIYLLTMKALDKSRFQTIRSVIFGGEGFPKSELLRLCNLYSSRVEFINVYGPTEGTCICSSHTITAADLSDLEGLPSLGTMNRNFDYLILDDQGRKSERGELCILGPNIGLGYYRDADRSKAVFLNYSDKGFYNDRMYKTGDLVCETNGLLYFLGRIDNQIKHMGYRIELEEIELALNAIPNVIQAAVIYERVNASYGKIVAFVASEIALESAALKKKLKEKLPDYMIPNLIQICHVLPKNPNGKVDRSKLRELLRQPELSQQAA